jgi:hypothetical protein
MKPALRMRGGGGRMGKVENWASEVRGETGFQLKGSF